MFPLGSIVFPSTAMPLQVFEPRYLTLLDRVLRSDGRFGTVLIERGSEVGGGDHRFDVGTLVRVLEVVGLEAGRRLIGVAGVERIRVVRWLPDDPHPWAEVERWPDIADGAGPELVAEARRRLERVLVLASELGADVGGASPGVVEDPGLASYQLAALSPVTSLDSYRLLAAAGPAARLRLVAELLADQEEVLRARLAEG
jgi:Lon protease-like protein